MARKKVRVEDIQDEAGERIEKEEVNTVEADNDDGGKEAKHSEESTGGDESDGDEGLNLMLDPSIAANGELVTVDFDFCDFRESDFHPVKTFITPLMDSHDFAVSDLADIIVNQVEVGTTIRVDESLVGFATVVPHLTDDSNPEPIKELAKFVLDKCPTDESRIKLEKILSGTKRCGWIFNERLLNLPPQISPPLIGALLEDVKWARENAEEHRERYSFDYFLVLTRAVVDRKGGVPASKKRKADGSRLGPELIFSRLEDSVLHESNTLSFTFGSSRPGTSREESVRVMMVATKAQMDAVLQKLQEYSS